MRHAFFENNTKITKEVLKPSTCLKTVSGFLKAIFDYVKYESTIIKPFISV